MSPGVAVPQCVSEMLGVWQCSCILPPGTQKDRKSADLHKGFQATVTNQIPWHCLATIQHRGTETSSLGLVRQIINTI